LDFIHYTDIELIRQGVSERRPERSERTHKTKGYSLISRLSKHHAQIEYYVNPIRLVIRLPLLRLQPLESYFLYQLISLLLFTPEILCYTFLILNLAGTYANRD